MAWDHSAGQWKQGKGKVKGQRRRLTIDDFDVSEGKWGQLSSRLRQKYGYAKDAAARHIATWEQDVHY